MEQAPLKLNVGCGRSHIAGWVNLDSYPMPGVDVVADLEACGTTPLPLADNVVGEFLLSHVLEHIHRVLPMMQELHRVARPAPLIAQPGSRRALQIGLCEASPENQ